MVHPPGQSRHASADAATAETGANVGAMWPVAAVRRQHPAARRRHRTHGRTRAGGVAERAIRRVIQGGSAASAWLAGRSPAGRAIHAGRISPLPNS
jgi:hypothetical protein